MNEALVAGLLSGLAVGLISALVTLRVANDNREDARTRWLADREAQEKRWSDEREQTRRDRHIDRRVDRCAAYMRLVGESVTAAGLTLAMTKELRDRPEVERIRDRHYERYATASAEAMHVGHEIYLLSPRLGPVAKAVTGATIGLGKLLPDTMDGWSEEREKQWTDAVQQVMALRNRFLDRAIEDIGTVPSGWVRSAAGVNVGVKPADGQPENGQQEGN